MTLGLQFGIWDFDWILNEMPPRIFNHWHARYLLEPWDMENRRSLAKVKYKAPPELKRDGKYMSKKDILFAVGKRR